MKIDRDVMTQHRLHAVLLGTCMLLMSLGASGATPSKPRFQSVAVLPIIISEADQPAHPTELGQRLAEAGSARAVQALMRRRVAAGVRRIAAAAECRAELDLLFIAEVTLPASLPQDEAGARAMFRKGKFATAVVRLERPDGKREAEASAALDWDDVRWLQGVRIRRARPSADVLHDAVRKVIDRAVVRLDQSARS